VDGHVLVLVPEGDYALVYIRIIIGGSRAGFGTRGDYALVYIRIIIGESRAGFGTKGNYALTCI